MQHSIQIEKPTFQNLITQTSNNIMIKEAKISNNIKLNGSITKPMNTFSIFAPSICLDSMYKLEYSLFRYWCHCYSQS